MGFSILKVNGNCDVNYLWTKEEGLSESDITDIAEDGIHSPTWDNKTIMLSLFNQNLYASDIDTPIVGYIIQKQKVGDTNRKNIAHVDSYTESIKDFNVENGASYKYYIIPIYNNDRTSGSYGEPIATDEVGVNFESWSIIGLKPISKHGEYKADKNSIWNFYINPKADDFSLNSDKTVSNGLGRFPKVHMGDNDYITGGLSCNIGNVACSTVNGEKAVVYENDNIKKLRRWRRFCNNGDLKLLRDPKGHIIPCEITDTPTYTVEYEYNEMPTTIKFSFTQIADSDKMVVYMTDEMWEM